MDGGLLSLRWNDHRQTFFTMLSSIRKKEVYTDVTLACDGRFYPAHRLVLSTCSDFFAQMFERTLCKHPIIVVANVNHGDLEALLNYMYLGEINVLQADLTTLMKAAEVLKIKGLAEPASECKDGKRLREDDTMGMKRKKLNEASLNKHPASNIDDAGSKVNSTSVSQSGSQASGGETWTRHKSRVRSGPGEPPEDDDNNTVPEYYSTDNDNTPSHPIPEVKMEEVCVKEEPTNWYTDNESDKFPHASTNLEFGGGGDGVAGSGGTAEYPSGGGGDGGGDAGGGGTSAAVWSMVQSQLMHHTQATTSTMPAFQKDTGFEKKGVGGRRKKLTNEERQQLFAIARANPDYSSEVLRNIIISEFDLNISSRTIRRELIEAGLKTLRPRTVFPYTSSMVEAQDIVTQPSDPVRQPCTMQPNTIHPNTEPSYTSKPNPVAGAGSHTLPPTTSPDKHPLHLS